MLIASLRGWKNVGHVLSFLFFFFCFFSTSSTNILPIRTEQAGLITYINDILKLILLIVFFAGDKVLFK